MVTPLVVDTDIGSNVDDAIALALAVRHPELDLRAVHGAERDTNLVLDPLAAVRSLSAGWPVRFVPADVTFGVVWTDAHVDRLRAGDELCRTLARLIDAWRARAKPAGAPDDVACWLHDPLGIACVTECEFVGVEQLPVTVMLDQQGLPHTVVDPTEGRRADVARTVDAAGFADWLVHMFLG